MKRNGGYLKLHPAKKPRLGSENNDREVSTDSECLFIS